MLFAREIVSDSLVFGFGCVFGCGPGRHGLVVNRCQVFCFSGLTPTPAFPPPPLSLLLFRRACWVKIFSQNMLVFDPQRRVSAKDAMEHPYFENLNAAVKNAGQDHK